MDKALRRPTMAPRYVTTGIADAWTPRRRRCHNPHWDGELLPMDKPTRPNLFTRLFKGGAK